VQNVCTVCPRTKLLALEVILYGSRIIETYICKALLDAEQIVTVDCAMKIRNVSHKGLRRFIESDDTAGIRSEFVPKLRKILAFLQDMEREDELRTVPSWKAHRLTGDRRNVWSLSVTRNWRITFLIDREEGEIVDLNYEDYH